MDYSSQSIRLATSILAKKSPAAQSRIAFHEFDILAFAPDAPPLSSSPTWLGAGFDVVLDKGTFDAVSLSGEKGEDGRRVCEGYRTKVLGLVKTGGRFLITSCNWTEEELRGWFEGGDGEEKEGGRLVFEDKVKYPSFKFGGKEGSSVCTLCFRRV